MGLDDRDRYIMTGREQLYYIPPHYDIEIGRKLYSNVCFLLSYFPVECGFELKWVPL